MAFLKFNKHELVNLSYSLKREIISANKEGAYCNTSIVVCNTRRYHGLLAVTLDRFGADRYLMLSSLDESLIVDGKQFNLGIHCYGDIYEPRGHKYVVDFVADPVPQITYKVGEILFRKSIMLVPDKNQVLIKLELLESPSKALLQLKPFLAFRNIHALTHQNPDADTSCREIRNGVSFCMYKGFPDLNLQMNTSEAKYTHHPLWYSNITYSDEYRRGYDCVEDLLVPGWFQVPMNPGDSVVFSASLAQENPSMFKKDFNRFFSSLPEITDSKQQHVRCADSLIINHNNHKRIHAGYSWKYTGLLRETMIALPGLTLYGKGDSAEFEEILDNLIADENERLYHKTTQVDAPLCLPICLQKYIAFGADEKKVWAKYGPVVRGILESYLPGRRQEVAMQPDGLLWAQLDGVALSWMNAYVNGRPVTERAGYQVETNAFWYNAICMALEMEEKYPSDSSFVGRWNRIRDLVHDSFNRVFWNPQLGWLADYVDNAGQHMEVRPNQMLAISQRYSPVDDSLKPSILRVIDNELVTPRGIRTLSPRDVNYRGVYEGSQIERDLAFHQGCTRPFLLEGYASLCFHIKGPSFWKKAQWLVEGFYDDLSKHGVGAFAELYDGDPPHEPHGAISSALSTAALLAVDYMLDVYKEDIGEVRR